MRTTSGSGSSSSSSGGSTGSLGRLGGARSGGGGADRAESARLSLGTHAHTPAHTRARSCSSSLAVYAHGLPTSPAVLALPRPQRPDAGLCTFGAASHSLTPQPARSQARPRTAPYPRHECRGPGRTYTRAPTHRSAHRYTHRCAPRAPAQSQELTKQQAPEHPSITGQSGSHVALAKLRSRSRSAAGRMKHLKHGRRSCTRATIQSQSQTGRYHLCQASMPSPTSPAPTPRPNRRVPVPPLLRQFT